MIGRVWLALERLPYTWFAATFETDAGSTRSLRSRLVDGLIQRIAIIVLFGYLGFATWLFHLLWRVVLFGSASDLPSGLAMALNGAFFIVFGLFSMWRYQQFLQGRCQEPGTDGRESAWTNSSSEP